MKLSIITTITNPDKRQDPWREAIECYTELADEVVVVRGSNEGSMLLGTNIKNVLLEWPDKWSWEELPKHLNRGLEEATGDWVIKCDIDYLFHEKDFDAIRNTLSNAQAPVVSFQKFSFTTVKKAYEKGGVPIAINKRRAPNIKFGIDPDKTTDLCYPILASGEYFGVPSGKLITQIDRSPIRVWNYDATFRTQNVQSREFHRFSVAYKNFFGEYKFGDSQNKSFDKFISMMKGRHDRAPYDVKLTDHPKYIKKKIKGITFDRFGYNGWGLL